MATMPNNRRPTANPIQPDAGTGQQRTPPQDTTINKKKLYGLLHDDDGTPRTSLVRALKIGFGLPSGPDVHVYLRRDIQNPWVVITGDQKQYFPDKQQARQAYTDARAKARPGDQHNAPINWRKYPIKFPYFTMTRLQADGSYWPDWDAIEQHGPMPTEIDVVFLSNDPFSAQFEAWTATNLKCTGDGRNAKRRVEWAHGPHNKDQRTFPDLERATKAGEEWFTIAGGCFNGGCPLVRAEVINSKIYPPACKPHGRLDMQLANSPRIGGSCTYDTTGKRGVKQIHTSLLQIRTLTGNGDPEQGTVAGIPMKLKLGPYKVTLPDGKSGTQLAVSLEIRAKDAVELARMINRQASDFRAATHSAPRLAAGATTCADDEVEDAEIILPEEDAVIARPEEQEADHMTSEFYGDFDGDLSDFVEDESTESQPGPNGGQQATEPTRGGLNPESFAPAEIGRCLRSAHQNNWNIQDEDHLHEFIRNWPKSKEDLIKALGKPPQE